jgi:membrane protein implicated in regulation of membrane protease activity
VTRYLVWRLAGVAFAAAGWVLIPLSLAAVWLTKQARRGEDHADIELLRASAQRRIKRQTKGTHS